VLLEGKVSLNELHVFPNVNIHDAAFIDILYLALLLMFVGPSMSERIHYRPLLLEEESDGGDVVINDKQTSKDTSSDVQKPKKQYGAWLPYLIMFCASVLNTCYGILVKEVSAVDPLVLVAFNGIGIACFSGIGLLITGHRPFPKGNMNILIMRSISSMVFVSAMNLGLRYLPMADCRTISATQVVWVAILGHIFIGEKCGLAEIQTVLTVLIGMVMVTRPPFLFGDDQATDTIKYDATYYQYVVILLVATIFQGCAFVLTRSLKELNFNVLGFWNGSASIAPSLLTSWALGTLALPPAKYIPHIVAMMILSVILQALMTLVLQMQEAATTAIIRRALDISMALLVQVLVYKDKPGIVAELGIILILITISLEGWRKRSQS